MDATTDTNETEDEALAAPIETESRWLEENCD